MIDVPEEYELVEFIAGGKIGKVYKAKNLETNELVAIKIIENKRKLKDHISRDREIPKLVIHDNIIKVIDFCEKKDHVFIVYPYIEGSMSIVRMLREKKIILKDCEQVVYMVKIMIQVCDAIKFMHSRHVVHRDIKPNNIIISGDSPILIDFDLAATLKDDDDDDDPNLFPVHWGIVGTPNYLDPEIWKSDDSIDYPLADIYSFGITLYYIFNKRKYPYASKSMEDLEYAIRYNKPIQSNTGIPQLDRLIMITINKNPDMRPGIDQIKSYLEKLIKPL